MGDFTLFAVIVSFAALLYIALNNQKERQKSNLALTPKLP
jgi:hypothetical protein